MTNCCHGIIFSISALVIIVAVGIALILNNSDIEDHNIDFNFVQIPCIEVKKSIKLFKGQIAGGESLGYMGDGVIISGMVDGRLMELNFEKNTAKTLLKLENSRPLGIRKINETTVGVADALLGFYLFNIKTKKVDFLIRQGDFINGIPVLFLDDFAYSHKRNMFYISQASSTFGVERVFLMFVHGGKTGRVLTYDLNTGEKGALDMKFAFPNGIELDKDEEILFINEFQRFSTLSFNLKTRKLSTFAIYPGYVDNIRSDGHDGYWIGVDQINKRFIYYMEKYTTFRAILYWLSEHELITPQNLFVRFGTFLHIDHNGSIDKCFCSSTGSEFMQATEIIQVDNKLFIGSYLPDVDFIAHFKTEELF